MTQYGDYRFDNVGRITAGESDWQKEVTYSTLTPYGRKAKLLHNTGRVTLLGREYDQFGTCLVDSSVELPSGVYLGEHVRIDEGVEFEEVDADLDERCRIYIGSNSRVKGTEIHRGVIIAPHVVMMAKALGDFSIVGASSRILEGVNIANGVSLGQSVRVDKASRIASGSRIGNNSRIGQRVTIGMHANIGMYVQVGRMRGEGYSRLIDIVDHEVVPNYKKVLA